MKKYVLACFNEDARLVSLKQFDTKDEARDEMKMEMKREERDAEDMGFDVESDCYENCAEVKYGENSYSWEIQPVYS